MIGTVIEAVQQGLVRGYLHRCDAPEGSVVLAHGAGSDANAAILVAMANAFAVAGINALRIDLPYRQDSAKGAPHPSKQARDREGIREALEFVRGSGPVYAAGHSYGGRMASMLLAGEAGLADALLLQSYPLHPPGKPEQLRIEHLSSLQVPTYFVHGTKDPFGSPQEMRTALEVIPARHELRSLDGAGHELKPLLKGAAEVVTAFLAFARQKE